MRNIPHFKGDDHGKGFSLVELMVAMVLGLLLLAGIVSAFVANRQVYRTNENMARLQETARIVNELMGRDIRAAGGNPCGARSVANETNSTDGLGQNGIALRGYDGSSGSPPAPPSGSPISSTPANWVSNTDSIYLLTATSGQVNMLTASPANYPGSGTVLVCDPKTASVGLGGGTISVSPACSDGCYWSPVIAALWYVGTNGNGGTSLFRSTASGAEEIVENVTDMQIQYLLRNSNTLALAAGYVGAGGISDWTNGATNQVVAVRVTLTLQTAENVGTTQGKIQRTVSFTTSIRNREVVQ